MMSKKQWFVLLTLMIIYMLLGACFFYYVQTRDEGMKRMIEKEQRREIEELLVKNYRPESNDTIGSRDEIFELMATYCGKPMYSNTTDDEYPAKWDFYHSLFFVITVVTTVGYGNLAPTTMLGRMVMIFYALVGIPINTIIMVTLGEYFGKSFIKLYHRWKTNRMEYDTARLGLIAQIILYLVPGFTFFVFLPAVVIMFFEDWDYDVAVYYAFVTLTTIGFGDIVAGVNEPYTNTLPYLIYRIFLLFWIIIGLGYVVMVFGFISVGLYSKKMHAFEHALAKSIKRTPRLIRNELRMVLQEFLLTKVKRVYKGEFNYTPTKRERTQSCPDLTIYRSKNSPMPQRKRAYSECVQCGELARVQSDTDLDYIDKEKTFLRRLSDQSTLLMRVANALGTFESDESGSESEVEGYDGFKDSEILASENWMNGSASALPPKTMRQRAFSEIQFPFSEKGNHTDDLTWYGPSATQKLQAIREEVKHGKARSRTLPIQPASTPNFISRLKNTIVGSKDNNGEDVEKQFAPKRNRANSEATNQYIKQTKAGRRSVFASVNDSILEETSLADFIRALTVASVPEAASVMPQRKLGTASLTPPKHSPQKTRRFAIRPVQSRRSSMMPPSPSNPNARRFSLKPAPVSDKTDFLAPPPYTPTPSENVTRRSIRAPGSNRRYSLRPVTMFTNPSPVRKQMLRSKEKDEFNERL